MAEDGLIGFKFYDNDDIAEDAAVLEVSDVLFSEVSFDHLGITAEQSKDATSGKAVRDVERPDDFDNFDFTEGFDFSF